MIQPVGVTTSDYCDALKAGNRTHVKIVFSDRDITFTDEDIDLNGGVTLQTNVNSDENLTYGNAASTEIAVSFIQSTKTSMVDFETEFRVDFGVEIGEDTYWTTVGYFTGKMPRRTKGVDVIEFVAHDRMQLFDVPADAALNGISYSGGVNILTIANTICNHVGVNLASFDDSTETVWTRKYYTKNPFVQGTTCRDVIADIAEATGMFAVINESGELFFNWYPYNQTAAYELSENDYFNADIADYTVHLPTVKFIDSSDSNNNSEIGTSVNNAYCIIDNQLIRPVSATRKHDDFLTKVFYHIGTIAYNPGTLYYPMTVYTIGNWLVQPGDQIAVYYTDPYTGYSRSKRCLVFSRTLTWNGGCNDVYESTGNPYYNSLLETNYASLRANNTANDLLTDKAGYVLDARQGKILNDSKQDTISLSSPSNITSSGLTIVIRKWGRITMLRITGDLSADKAAGATLATITDGYRPAMEIYFPLHCNQNGSINSEVLRFHITTAGVFECRAALSQDKTISGIVTYISQE